MEGQNGITQLVSIINQLFSGLITNVMQPTYNFITKAGNELLLIPIVLMLVVFAVSAVRKLWQGV